MDAKSRIEELVNILNEANKQYYLDDNPTLTDNEYDSLLMELFKLEEENPEYVLPESPTHSVGTKVLDAFEKIRHQTPMFSFPQTPCFPWLAQPAGPQAAVKTASTGFKVCIN